MNWMRVKAIARRHAYVMIRSPHRLFDISVWPVVDVVLFGSIGAFVAQAEGPGSAAFGYLLGGIVLWHVIYQAQIALSTGFMEETWSRNLLNLMVTPLKETEYVAGVVLFGLVKLVLGVSLVSAGALLFFAFDITDLGLGLIPISAILLVVGWLIALLVIGVMLRFGSGAEVLIWGILFVVMPLSGVFYPVEALPGVIRPISYVLPTTHAFNAMRTLLDTGTIDWGALALATVAAVLMAIVSVLFVWKMLELFRRRGYISRYA